MLFIGSELAPPVSMQQVVHRRQGHRTTQRGLQQWLDLGHHQDATGARAIQERLQHLNLLFRREVLMVSPTTRRRGAITDDFTANEGIAQSARPTDRQPNHCCRRFQTQAMVIL